MTQTTDDLRARYIKQMGEELGNVYFCLWQEVAGLYLKWNQYVMLYGADPSSIGLLNKSAPAFFRIVQDGLWENIMLHIARLTDPPCTGKYKNLTVKRLPELVKENCHLRNKIELLICTANNATKFCREWRDKRYAHLDLDLILKNTSPALPDATRAKTRCAIEALAKILDAVSAHFLDSSTRFDMLSPPGGGEVLLKILEDSIKARENVHNYFSD